MNRDPNSLDLYKSSDALATLMMVKHVCVLDQDRIDLIFGVSLSLLKIEHSNKYPQSTTIRGQSVELGSVFIENPKRYNINYKDI